MAPTLDKSLKDYARTECLDSGLTIARLFRRYFHDFSPQHISIWLPQTAVTAAYVLLEDLESRDVQDLYYSVCRVITSASRRWFCMRGHARMLLVTAEQNGYVIPQNAKLILRKVAVEGWKVDDHKHFEGSIFPNYALANGEDPKMSGMGDLLEQWKNLNLEEESRRKTTAASDSDRLAGRRSPSTDESSESSTDMELDRPV